MVEDVYGGITNTRLDLANGHKNIKDYWFDNGQQTLRHIDEAWAEFFSAQINNFNTNININKDWFPEATEKLEEFAILLDDYYQSQ